jgi:16S rRNA G966 N2-methylase RsmD
VTWPVHPAADLFPLATEDELEALADDIRKRGLILPVSLWDNPEQDTFLLDGRNRIAACELAGVEVRTRMYEGGDPFGEVISLNVKHRHLSESQRGVIAAGLVTTEGRGRPSNSANLPNYLQSDVAPMFNVSERTVSSGVLVRRTGPDLVEQVISGRLPLARAERIIRDRDAQGRRITQAKAEAAMSGEPATVDIRVGDFREVLADLSDVDAIITDPPYGFEFLPLLADLAVFADKVLAPDGVLVVLMGQTHLPDVYRLLDGGRPYRWTGCYLTSGPAYVSHARRMHSNWKPLLMYGGGSRVSDVIESEGSDADAKSHHRWGQDYSAFHTIIERFTTRGQTVVDPFMGSGTTLLAAHAQGRHAIGCDVDPEAIATCRERLA